MKRYLAFIAVAALAFSAISCDKNEPERKNEFNGTPIVFRCAETKSLVNNLDTVKVKGFKVAATRTYEGEVYVDVFANHPESVSYSSSGDAVMENWPYSTPRYWLDNGIYDFVAFTNNSIIQVSDKTCVVGGTYDITTCQDDILMAYAQNNMASKDSHHPYVHLTFKHICAAIEFKVLADDAFDAAPSFKYLAVTGVSKAGTIQYGSGSTVERRATVNWTPALAVSDTMYKWSGSFTIPNDGATKTCVFNNSRKYTNGSTQYASGTTDGFATAIPQTLSADAAVTFSFTPAGGAEIKATKSLKTASVTSWEPGKKYIYTINLKPVGLEITVVTTDWDEVEATTGEEIVITA